jgi:hypothetical protein
MPVTGRARRSKNRFMRRLVSLLFASASVVVLACTNGTPRATAPTTVTLEGDAGMTVIGETPDPPAASTDGGPDFFACGSDLDCVAVPRAQCCPNGFMEAVNKDRVDAYRTSVTCDRRHRMCPQYRVFDRRAAICGNISHRCEMVMPDHIACSGTGPEVHVCPHNALCDASGHCPAFSPPAAPAPPPGTP